jgi:hypothetical protein
LGPQFSNRCQVNEAEKDECSINASENDVEKENRKSKEK